MSSIFIFQTDAMQIQHTLDEVPDATYHHMHAHDKYEILYILSGKGHYLVESTVYTLQPGSMLLMRPGEVHKLDIDPDTPYERFCIHFERQIVDPFPSGDKLLDPFHKHALGCDNHYTAQEFDSHFVHDCMRHMEEADGRPMYGFVMHNTIPALLTEIYQAFYRRRKVNPASGDPVIQTRLQEILAYINEHINENLSLDDLCQRFYISKTQLGRFFYKTTGSTVWDYILVKRLIEARRLILTGVPITHAAQSCGFHDYSAFYRAYRKRYGSSPAKDKRAYTFEKA